MSLYFPTASELLYVGIILLLLILIVVLMVLFMIKLSHKANSRQKAQFETNEVNYSDKPSE